jgi:Tol biopolymer transport system component/DNA-binding SARP family transcriptional activator
MTSEKFRLRTFGGLSLTVSGASEPLPAVGRKRLVLLAILCAEPGGPVPRDRLLAILWPEVDDVRARNALKQLVYIVRRELGQELIIEVSGGLLADPDRITSDVQDFRRALSDGALTDAVSVCTGPFLDAVHLRDTPEFEHWVDARRHEFATAHLAALEQLGTAALAAGDSVNALRWTRALSTADPLNSRGALLVARALDESGDRAGAIQHLERHSALLGTDLGVDAPADVQKMLRRLRVPVTVGASAPLSANDPPIKLEASSPMVETEPRPTPLGRRKPRTLIVGAVLATTMGAWIAGMNANAPIGGPKAGPLVRLTLAQSAEMEPALSPDGRWLVYSASERGDARVGSNSRRLYLQPSSGGQAIPLTPRDSVHDQTQPAWSPDGSSLAFIGEGVIKVVASFGGATEQILPVRAVTVGGWSHRGRRLAYTDSAGVWTYDLDRDSARFVTPAGFSARTPAWAPDDETLAFVVGTGAAANVAASSIWVVPARGGPPTRVTDSVHMSISPAFDPLGRGLFYTSNRDGAGDIFFQPLDQMKRPRGPAVRLTTGAHATQVAVSADGKALVFASARATSNIWSAPIGDSPVVPDARLRQVTFGDQEIECLSLSPDGRWLLYDSNRSGNQDIYKVGLDGGGATQLTRNAVDDFCPVMSPTSQEILFYSFQDGYRRLFTMSTDGAKASPVLPVVPGEQVWFPQWSSDGNRIAFTYGSSGAAKHAAIISRGPDGTWGNRTNFAGLHEVSWSPDGHHLVASSDSGLIVLSPETGRRRVLVPKTKLGRWYISGWGRDSSVVYYHLVDGESEFFAVPLAGGEPRPILRLANPRAVSRRVEFATDGKRMFFTLAGDEASIWRLALSW